MRNVAVGDPVRNTRYDAVGNRKRDLGGIAGFAGRTFSSGGSAGSDTTGSSSGDPSGPGVFTGTSSDRENADRDSSSGSEMNQSSASRGFDQNKMDEIRNNRDPLGGVDSRQTGGGTVRRNMNTDAGSMRSVAGQTARRDMKRSGTVSRGPSGVSNRVVRTTGIADRPGSRKRPPDLKDYRPKK